MPFKESALNYKVTEDFLLDQRGVVDASVWIDSGTLCAHVTLHEGAVCDFDDLKLRCEAKIGLAHTPYELVLIAAHRRFMG